VRLNLKTDILSDGSLQACIIKHIILPSVGISLALLWFSYPEDNLRLGLWNKKVCKNDIKFWWCGQAIYKRAQGAEEIAWKVSLAVWRWCKKKGRYHETDETTWRLVWSIHDIKGWYEKIIAQGSIKHYIIKWI